jgi:phosphoglycolate phosphatase-like HAD superfamily hydrolase
MSRLGVQPSRTVMIGDIASDLDAAAAAGVLGVLVPTPVTRQEEVAAADLVAPDLAAAVELAAGELAATQAVRDGQAVWDAEAVGAGS